MFSSALIEHLWCLQKLNVYKVHSAALSIPGSVVMEEKQDFRNINF